MSDSENIFEILKALALLRRALRTGPSGNAEPRLSVAQVPVVLHLADAGQMPMGELAKQLGVSCPAATDLVDRLVAAGWVERINSPQDRRKVLVQLTPPAKEIAQGAVASRRQKVAAVLDQLSEQERTGFVRGITLLADALSAGIEDWGTRPPSSQDDASLSPGLAALPR